MFSVAFLITSSLNAQYFNGNYSTGGRLTNGFSNVPFNSYAAVGNSAEFIRLNASGNATTNKRFVSPPTAPYVFSFNDIKPAPLSSENYGIFGAMTHTSSGVTSPVFMRVSSAGAIGIQTGYLSIGYSGLNFTAADVIPVIGTAPGEYYATGTAVPAATPSSSLIYLTRLNSSGIPSFSFATQLLKSGLPVGAEPKDILVSGNNVFVVGTAFEPTGPTFAFIIQFNRISGSVIRRFRLNVSTSTGINVFTINSIKNSSDGKFYLTGYAKPSGPSSTTPRPLLMKVDLASSSTSAPLIIWAKTYSVLPTASSSFYEASDVDEASGSIYLSVRPFTSPLSEGKILLRLNNAGNLLSASAYNVLGGLNGGAVSSVDATSSKNEVVMFGYTTYSSCCSPVIDKTYIGKARLDGTIPNTPNCPNASYSATASPIALTFVGLTHTSSSISVSPTPLSLNAITLSGGPCSTSTARLAGESEEESIAGEYFAEKKLTVFPNPVNKNEKLYLAVPEQTGSAFIQIFDYSGKLVLSQSIDLTMTEHQINSSELISGVYFLVCKSPKSFDTQKFIVK